MRDKRTARNDFTGKDIKTGVPTDAYRNGFDAIDWSKKAEPSGETSECLDEAAKE